MDRELSGQQPEHGGFRDWLQPDDQTSTAHGVVPGSIRVLLRLQGQAAKTGPGTHYHHGRHERHSVPGEPHEQTPK